MQSTCAYNWLYILQIIWHYNFPWWNTVLMRACAKSLQLCPTLWNPTDCSLPGSTAHGILLARILDWGTMPSSTPSSWPREQTFISYFSCIGSQGLYLWSHLGSLLNCITFAQWDSQFLMGIDGSFLPRASKPHCIYKGNKDPASKMFLVQLTSSRCWRYSSEKSRPKNLWPWKAHVQMGWDHPHN